MTKEASVRMTSRHHLQLLDHLFPGDGREAVAIAICGRSEGPTRETLLVQQVEPVPYSICQRAPDFISWPTDHILPLLDKAAQHSLRIIKFHSHPGGFAQFSSQDDRSDRSLFPFISNWTGDGNTNASVVVLPGGRMFGRTVGADSSFKEVSSVAVTGDDLSFWYPDARTTVPEFAMRHAQLFGAGTTQTMRKLRIGVVGCSGTGSIVVLQLAHFGVAHLVLVDPDVVEEKNLNRIPGASMAAALKREFKESPSGTSKRSGWERRYQRFRMTSVRRPRCGQSQNATSCSGYGRSRRAPPVESVGDFLPSSVFRSGGWSTQTGRAAWIRCAARCTISSQVARAC